MKFALSLALVLSLGAGAAVAAPAGPAQLAVASRDGAVETVDYYRGRRPYPYPRPHAYPRPPYGYGYGYGRPVPRPYVGAWPRPPVYGGCVTRVVRYTYRGPVVTVINRCGPYRGW